MKNSKLILFIIFVSVLISTFANANNSYAYQVKHQSPSQLIQAMKPHLSKETVITVHQNQLLITATKVEQEKIIQMLNMLDKALRDYLIELKILDRRLDNWEMKGETKNVKRYQTGSSRDNNKHFRIKLREGYRGFIETGETFQQHTLVEHYGKFIPKTTNKNLKSGVHLSLMEQTNNQVSVNLFAGSQNRATPNSSSTQSSGVNSQFNANKNEWILVATINVENEKPGSKQYSTSSARQKKRFYYLRVKDLTQR